MTYILDNAAQSIRLARPLSYAQAAQEDRSAPRVKVRIPATLRPSGEQRFQVEVTTLSLSGFSCLALTGQYPGRLCWLTLPGFGALQAEVVRNDGMTLGCAFANLLSPAVLDHIVLQFAE